MGRTAGTEAYRWDSMGCPSLSICPLGTEGWDGQLAQRPVIGDSMGCPSLSICLLGTEGWDRQLGQRPTEGTPWDCNVHPPLLGAMPWDSWESQIPSGQSMAILDKKRTKYDYS